MQVSIFLCPAVSLLCSSTKSQLKFDERAYIIMICNLHNYTIKFYWFMIFIFFSFLSPRSPANSNCSHKTHIYKKYKFKMCISHKFNANANCANIVILLQLSCFSRNVLRSLCCCRRCCRNNKKIMCKKKEVSRY